MLSKLLAILGKRASASTWARYNAVCEQLGLSGTVLFLSFDCDTDQDAAAGLEVADSLYRLGLKASFAVPGAQLLNNRKIYAHLASLGYEFLNHGLRPHAAWNGSRYYAITFYNEMTRQEVEKDIREADAVIREVTGQPPQGFRAPHFGSFQKPEEVAFMHRVCAELGYAYSSTTLPKYALERGPAFFSEGLVELPVMGSWREPHVILDSWNYLEDRVNYRLSATYFERFEETLRLARKSKTPRLLCWYADPSHVLGQKPFEQAMRLAAEYGLPSYTGGQCAGLFRAALEKSPCAA